MQQNRGGFFFRRGNVKNDNSNLEKMGSIKHILQEDNVQTESSNCLAFDDEYNLKDKEDFPSEENFYNKEFW